MTKGGCFDFGTSHIHYPLSLVHQGLPQQHPDQEVPLNCLHQGITHQDQPH